VSTVDAKDRVELFNLLTHTPEGSALELLAQAESMTESHGPVPALMLFKADLLDALGRSRDSLEVVRAAATAHPTDRDLNGELLKREQERTHLQQMAVAIRRELQQNPSNGEAQRDLAITLHRLQRFSEAERLYRRLLKEHPANDEFRVDLARMFASQARYDTALSTLAPALRRPKHDPSVDCLAGKLMSRGKGRAEAAAQLLSQCE
jgi:Flp pilus assembly protein TadD